VNPIALTDTLVEDENNEGSSDETLEGNKIY
jgi:hypothetical protein